MAALAGAPGALVLDARVIDALPELWSVAAVIGPRASALFAHVFLLSRLVRIAQVGVSLQRIHLRRGLHSTCPGRRAEAGAVYPGWMGRDTVGSGASAARARRSRQ